MELHLLHSHTSSLSSVSPKLSPEPSKSRPRHRISTQFRRNTIISLSNSDKTRRNITNKATNHDESRRNNPKTPRGRRREILVTPILLAGSYFLRSMVAKAEETVSPETKDPTTPVEIPAVVVEEKKKEEEVIVSRVYDATVIGEPQAVVKDKTKVWDKLMNARIVYLGEAEQVPVRDDKEVELEIIKNLRSRCLEKERMISVAIEEFPCDLQELVNQYMDKRIDGKTLKASVSHWPDQRWEEYEPILTYCRDNGVRLVACGTPLEILRTVQAEGIRGLSKTDRKQYAPPAGSGFIAGFTSMSRKSLLDTVSLNQTLTFGPMSYLSAQARVVEDYTMSQIILQATVDGGSTGMLVVITGASHVMYGQRGTGLPARISKKLQKKNQVVILLDPERQQIRREGEVPVADFLWYSAARPCSRNCFDRAEIARVMNAAGRRRDALPQDLQKGLDLGVVSPEVLQNFFDLEKYPYISELTHRFQGFRERLLADPKFLQRLAIEESISITTTLIAQYEKRKENFFEEIDYVITDTVRGSVVDFFTVWLPAPTLSFLSQADGIATPGGMDALKSILESIPDNAFQEAVAGKNWTLSHRIASVVFGGLKLAGVGFISSIAAVASSNILYGARRFLNPASVIDQRTKRSPLMKTAVVYSSFLGTSANLRYQIIAGLVERRISDHLLSSQPLLANALSFVVRTINSFWGTTQWIDIARVTGLQTRASETTPLPSADTTNTSVLSSETTDEATIDDIKNKSGDNPTS